MRHAKWVIVVVMALLLATAGTALAANPHFVWVRASLDGSSLVVKFKEAGLGNNEWVHIVASADATAAYACRNHGGNFPMDPKKHWVSGLVSAGGDFESGKNGNVTDMLVVPAPAFDPAAAGDCPGNQVWTLVGIRYENIKACDETNGICEWAKPSSITKLFYNVKFDPWNP